MVVLHLHLSHTICALFVMLCVVHNRYNVSNVQVRYLRIAETHKSYKPYRWVRYVTQSSSYVCRL